MARKKKDKSFDDLLNEYKRFIATKDDVRPFDPISTGTISIDVSTGIGGIPRYRWSNIWGPKSSGKTTLALNICKSALNNKDGKVLYIDIEAGLDWSRIENIVGVDLLYDADGEARFILIQPATSEQSFEIAEVGIESNEFDVIVFDSIGALAPSLEKDNKFTESTVGLNSRLLGKFLRRNSETLIHSDKTAFLFINQLRADIGNRYNEHVQPGGYQLEHALSMEIRLYSARRIKVGDSLVGSQTKFTISKNKCAIPWKTAELYITFGKGVDREKDAMEFAKLIGVIQLRGSYYYFEGESIEAGMVKSIERLENDKELLDRIEKMCYNSQQEVPEEIDEIDDEDIDIEEIVEENYETGD